MNKENVKDILKRYEAKIESEIHEESQTDYSGEYSKFREETLAPLNGYERACKSVGRVIKLKLSPKDEAKLKKTIDGARLDIEPGEAAGFGMFALLAGILVSALACMAVFLITGKFPMMVFVLLFFVSFFVYYYINSLPARLEQRWRLKASSQMVPCILYIVIYMKHTSNLERAIHFASQHLQPPLSLDLKKIFWNVQTGKYATLKDALDAYLEQWRGYSLEFIEAMHLIESSLYEPSEERRTKILEKSLEIMLDGIYEKMLTYAHDVQSPITNIYMLGIVLPTLGLALLPLASTLLQGAIKWYHVMILFDIIVPFMVFYMTNSIMDKRPGGFGETELLERNPNYHYYKDKKHYTTAFFVALPFFIIGILPFILYFGFHLDPSFSSMNIPFKEQLGDQKFFDFRKTDAGNIVGPFGPIALLLSVFVPFSIALFFITAYKLKTQKLISMRKNTKQLETEFASSIFQLGNRLADGIPAEMAFGRVANSLKGTPTAGFFSIVNMNIQQAGMGIEEAVFSRARGAVNYYPSELIKTSMKILIESSKKGLEVAARAMMSISEYVKNIHKVNERLKDLLADVTSGMKSNMTFLAPLLAAIVVGLASMITMILSKLGMMISAGTLSDSGFMGMGANQITTMFNVTAMIPPYWLQITVGIYIIEIIFILTGTLVSIEAGEDRLGEKYETGKTLKQGISLYMITSIIAIIALAMLAMVAVSGIA